MKIVVIGCIGRIGVSTRLVLVEHDYETVAAYPSTDVDTRSPARDTEALADATVVVDMSNTLPSRRPRYGSSSKPPPQPARGGSRSGRARHDVALSAVGAERLQHSGRKRLPRWPCARSPACR